MRAVLLTIGAETFQFSFTSMFLRPILAGWLIALIIPLLPFAESAMVAVDARAERREKEK